MNDFDVTIRGETYTGVDSGGTGPAVLFLHGWPDDRSLWRHQVKNLAAKGYRAIAIDWIGHGQSSQPQDIARYSIDELVDDLEQLLLSLKTGPVHIVAHDYGAIVAWEFCSKHNDLVSSFVALSIGHPAAILRHITLESLRNNWFLLFNALPFAVPIYKANEGKFFNWAMKQHPDQKAIVRRLLEHKDPLYIRIWELANPPSYLIKKYIIPSPEIIPKVMVPALGIAAIDDEYSTVRSMQKSGKFVNKDWEVVRINDAGHWMQLKRPELINKILVNWLAKHAGMEKGS